MIPRNIVLSRGDKNKNSISFSGLKAKSVREASKGHSKGSKVCGFLL